METGGALRLLRNDSATGHWLGLRVTDPALGGRDAIGAHVVLWASGEELHRSVIPGYGFLSSNDPRVHFGLNNSSGFDSLRVLWPGGDIEYFDGGAVDKWMNIERGQGKVR
jgi:hypothetical protein